MREKRKTKRKVKPRLLIATDCLLPRWDGIARFLAEVLPGLSKHYSITVIAPDYRGRYEIPGINIIKLSTFSFRIGDYQPSKPQVKIIRRCVEEADFIWSQSIGPIGALAILTAHKAGKKVVSYIHSLEWDLFIHSISVPKKFVNGVRDVAKRIVRYIYSRCDLLLVPSADIGKAIRKVGIRTSSKVVTLGTDFERFIPAKDKRKAKKRIGIDPDHYVIGFCGRLGNEKDLPTLYNAFKELEKDRRYTDKVKLLIVGDGKRKIISRFRSRNLIWTGPQDNVVQYLQAMDIFVLPSLTETSSLATMEAMSCGLAVVATKVGYVKRYIKKGKNGMFFQKQNHNSLAKKLKYLLRNDDIRAMLGDNARKTIVQKHSWNNTIGSLIDCFRSLGF